MGRRRVKSSVGISRVRPGADSALEAGVEEAMAEVEHLREVLSRGVRQGRLLFPPHKMGLV